MTIQVEGYVRPDGTNPSEGGSTVWTPSQPRRLIVLFGGGTKKGQERDIASALALHQEYKNRKAAAVQKPAARHKKKR